MSDVYDSHACFLLQKIVDHINQHKISTASRMMSALYYICSMMVRMFFTAVERLMKYDESTMPQEPDWVLKTDPKKGTWPTNGTLEFKNVEMAYREGLPPAIRDVNVNIDSGKHIGIVGRTGAGKTSFIVVLFRIVDCQKGSIKLDGKELDKLGLHTVRRALAIIPQTPLLIPGTLAHNLDPFDKYSENKEAVAHNFISQDGNYTDILQTETIVVLQGPLYKDPATTLPSVLTVGVGNAYIINNDRYIEGTWRRGDIIEPFVLTDMNGEDIQVPPSTQWIHILPNEGEIILDN